MINEKLTLIYSLIDKIANQLDIPYVVIGASARDVITSQIKNIPVKRATHDIDFAVQVADWQAFEDIKVALIAKGFHRTELLHRLKYSDSYPVDIVPFGGVSDANNKLTWPPKNEITMDVLGFKEACEHAITVPMGKDQTIKVPVVSAPGFILLKLLAWQDRDRQYRQKDATDIWFMISVYEKFPKIEEQLYSLSLIKEFDGDTTLIGAYLLGHEITKICLPETKKSILRLLTNQDLLQKLSIEMTNGYEESIDANLKLLAALQLGFDQGH